MENHQDFVQFNCNGIRGNRIHIQQLIIKYSPKFILLQELKIKKKDKIKFKGYTFISKFIDDESTFKPSVGMLIKDGIIFSLIDTPSDICVIGINTFNYCPISLYSFYDNHRIDKISESNLMKLIKLGQHKPLIMGDFNVRNVMWDRNLKNTWNDRRTTEILNFIANSDLVLLNDGSPTRVSPVFNINNSALDLSLIHKDLCCDFIWNVSNSTFGSDHIPTLVTSVGLNLNPHEHVIWDLKSTDWDVFNDSCRFELIKDELDINLMDKIIHDQIFNGLSSSTNAFFSPNNKKRVPPWWDIELQNLKIEKNKLLNQYLPNQSKENLIALKKFNALYKRALKSKKLASWEKFIEEMNDDDMEARILWKRIKMVDGKNYDRSIHHLLNEKDEIVEDPEIIVNMLADHYRKVSDSNDLNEEEKINFNLLKNKVNLAQNAIINKFKYLDDNFSLEELTYAIANTKSNSAPGPDGFKYLIYKKLNVRNLSFLLQFYNRIWSLGRRPNTWNKSNIIPIPKSPIVHNPTQSRPINLINGGVKLMDKMVNSRLMFTLEESNFINGNQFGFRRNKRTINSLMKLNNYIIKTLESGSHIQLISFDIKKAFDKVWPQAILQKFQQYEIGGNMFHYIQSFLDLRRSLVINGKFISNEITTNMGVPQGSPLSSTLFLVAFQNIIEDLETIDIVIEFSAYADDLFIYSNNVSNLVNTKNIQKCINKISKAGLEVGLEFSIEKTKSLHICNKRNCNQISNKLYNNPIPKVDNLKILGLTFQRNFKFDKHIALLQVRLRKDLQIIKVLSSRKYGLNQHLLRRIIISLSVSKIQYCIEIFGHSAVTHIKKLDVILDKMKRLMLGSFISTPLISLAIQSGIPNVSSIALKCNMLCSIKMERSSYNLETAKNMHIIMVNEFLVSMNLFTVNIVKDVTMVSPQKSIRNQVFPNIFKKKKSEIERNTVELVINEFKCLHKIDASLFVDGSKTLNGVAYAVTSEEQIFETRKLHVFNSVFTSEAYAVLRAIKILQQLNPNGTLKFIIFSDSKSTIDELISNSRKKNEIINKIKSILTPNIFIVWIPSHFGIVGNEFVDSTARDTSNSNFTPSNYVSSGDTVKVIKNYIDIILQRQWDLQHDNKLFKVNPLATYSRFYSSIPRKFEWIINRLRSGHTNATHCYLITKSVEPECVFCKDLLTVEHIFTCNEDSMVDSRWKFKIDNWKEQLFEEAMIDNIIDYIKEIGYFYQI